jgi:hypothetical protein
MSEDLIQRDCGPDTNTQKGRNWSAKPIMFGIYLGFDD